MASQDRNDRIALRRLREMHGEADAGGTIGHLLGPLLDRARPSSRPRRASSPRRRRRRRPRRPLEGRRSGSRPHPLPTPPRRRAQRRRRRRSRRRARPRRCARRRRSGTGACCPGALSWKISVSDSGTPPARRSPRAACAVSKSSNWPTTMSPSSSWGNEGVMRPSPSARGATSPRRSGGPSPRARRRCTARSGGRTGAPAPSPRAAR